MLALAVLLSVTGPTSAPAAAPAAAPTKPLRTLVYHVDYSVQTKLEMTGSGLSQAGPAVTAGQPADVAPTATSSNGAASGSGNETRGMDTANKGDLRVDVIAAGQDGALVVDISLEGTTRTQPPIRVLITPTGGISYDPKSTLAPEAALLAPLFSAGLLGTHDIAAGDHWSVGWNGGAKGANEYAIAAVDGDTATIKETVSGSQGAFHRDGTATIQYAVRQLDPISYKYIGTDRNQASLFSYRTDRIIMTAELASDTFAKR